VAGIADLVDARGASADRMLEHARIPLSVREDPLGFVPGRCVWTFVDEVARREGPRDFLFEVTRSGQWRRARWVPPLAHAVTLGDALRRMCVSWVREIPMVRMGLTVNGPAVCFWRERIPDVSGWEGNEQAEQYTLSYMLRVIRAAAGPKWRPDRLRLESAPGGWGTASPALTGIRKQYNRRRLAVSFPTQLLALPISIRPLSRPGPAGEPAGKDFESSLRQVLLTSLAGGLPHQELIANILGLSSRSLRRRFKEEDTSWRSVVLDVKFERANERLLQGRTSMLEVAQELGFSDAARFFERRTGVAPSRWRAHVERAKGACHP